MRALATVLVAAALLGSLTSSATASVRVSVQNCPTTYAIPGDHPSAPRTPRSRSRPARPARSPPGRAAARRSCSPRAASRAGRSSERTAASRCGSLRPAPRQLGRPSRSRSRAAASAASPPGVRPVPARGEGHRLPVPHGAPQARARREPAAERPRVHRPGRRQGLGQPLRRDACERSARSSTSRTGRRSPRG